MNDHQMKVNEYTETSRQENERTKQYNSDIETLNVNLGEEKRLFLSGAKELVFGMKSKADLSKEVKRKPKLKLIEIKSK